MSRMRSYGLFTHLCLCCLLVGQVEPKDRGLITDGSTESWANQVSRSNSLDSSTSTAWFPQQGEHTSSSPDSRDAGVGMCQHDRCSLEAFQSLDMDSMITSSNNSLEASQEWPNIRMFRTVPLVHDEELTGLKQPILLAHT